LVTNPKITPRTAENLAQDIGVWVFGLFTLFFERKQWVEVLWLKEICYIYSKGPTI
jgi:hypothetical protein